MATPSGDDHWSGSQEFQITGVEGRDNTLRIETNCREDDHTLRLTLPTLCITYADMRFANAIGGEQANYPASRDYGRFFSPPVELLGEAEIEKFTWIRGAHRVSIGPDRTTIEWFAVNALVIPRFRVDPEEAVPAVVGGEGFPINQQKPLTVSVMQFADGRHVGGISIEKRHPEWQPRERAQEYDLWVQVVDGETLEPMPRAALNRLQRDPNEAAESGDVHLGFANHAITDEQGILQLSSLTCQGLEAITLQQPGKRAVARCYRALPGQSVRLVMRCWSLEEDVLPFRWSGDGPPLLEEIAEAVGRSPEEILRLNELADMAELMARGTLLLPCHAAKYRLEDGDTIEWLAEAFGYSGVDELAAMNELTDELVTWAGQEILLPGWRFLRAPTGIPLPRIEELFGLPGGWVRPVGRVYHPDPRHAYESEFIGIPLSTFVESHPGSPQ